MVRVVEEIALNPPSLAIDLFPHGLRIDVHLHGLKLKWTFARFWFTRLARRLIRGRDPKLLAFFVEQLRTVRRELEVAHVIHELVDLALAQVELLNDDLGV